MQAKHTPGPWHIGMKPGPIVYGPQGEEVAGLTVPMVPQEENRANARLIAAAPDLLAALRACTAALTEAGKDFALANPNAVRPNLYELHAIEARAALAKAEGGAE